MLSKNIFIDTQAFMQQGFKFQSATLKKILDLGNACTINLIVSDVVRREVDSKLHEKASRIIEKATELKKDLYSLQHKTSPELEAELTNLIDAVGEDLRMAWRDYLLGANALILDPSYIDISELISMYFEGTSPFSSGKKKDEFPDAISLLSLKAWAIQNKQIVYVVTRDKDFNGFSSSSENLILLSSITEFLDLYNRAEVRLGEEIHRIIASEAELIKSNVRAQFLECSFSCDGSDDPEVESVMVADLKFEEFDIISIENGKVFISLPATIIGNANIFAYDYDHGIWDGEEKEYIHVDTYHMSLDFSETYEVTFAIHIDLATMKIEDFDQFLFDGSDEIDLHYDDGYPYK